MRVSISVIDKTVVKDKECFQNIDMSGIPSNVNAIQWYGTTGHIEYIDETKLPRIWAVGNETITDFSPYQKYVDACTDENRM
jgi:hypothetical protein|tara:strand:- start:1 stop:246 length:246 start_codon:yes stop_codon:yes gene_type:complete